jgi:outer membrane protein assembly factor BamB
MKAKAIVLTFALLTGAAIAEDWPSWRGPQRNAISGEKGLLDSWTEQGPPLLWQAKGLGGGYSGVAIVGDRIYTMGSRKGGAHLIALELKDGKEVWATLVGGGGPNCTPTVDGELVYALGRDGDLLCANAATGKEVWRKNFGKDFGGRMMSGWGYSESPLVDGDRLICTPGAGKAILAALDKKTGATVWESPMPADAGKRGGDGAAYSSVVISNACGVKQYVQLTGRGIVSVAAADGKPLWVYNRVANGTANIPTPIVKDDYVFCSSGYGTGAALLKVVRDSQDGQDLKAEEVYFLPAKDMQNHHGGMVLIGDHVYCGHGHNQGFPLCVELKTGKIAWSPGRGPGTGSAAVLYADGHLYFRYENGIMALIEANPQEYKLKGSFKLASVKGASWPHPTISNGKLYLRDQDVLMCYDIRR